MEIVGYLAAALMGLSLGMMGAGGSILTVPILVYLFALSPLQATTYSLFIVGATAIIGGLSYLRKGEVDLKTGVLFALPSFLGVVTTRMLVIPRLPDPLLTFGSFVLTKSLLVMGLFALLMILAARAMLRPVAASAQKPDMNVMRQVRRIVARGLLVGIVTGFVGAGGGFLIIPALVILVGLRVRTAVGTSLLIIAANSLLGFASDLRQQTALDWRLLISVSVTAVVGLGIGTTLSHRISEQVLKKAFGFFVLFMGVLVLGDQIRRL